MGVFSSRLDPKKEVLQVLFAEGYKADFIRHLGAWSVHLRPSAMTSPSSGQAFGGTASDKELALNKAVSEYVERQAMIEYFSTQNELASIDSSGFAARPYGLVPWLTKLQVRNTARLEAMERFYGSAWFHNLQIGHTVIDLETNRLPLFRNLGLHSKFSNICLVQINTPHWEDVLILVGLLPTSGFVVGCAAGWIWNRGQTLYRAAVELMRHAAIVKSILTHDLPVESEYTNKLIYHATGAADGPLRNRLSIKGTSSCDKPEVEVDESVPHRFAKHYYVHRFIFKNQPKIFASLESLIV